MRVSTSLTYQQGIRNILTQQSELYRMQNQISSGKKDLLPSADPSGASRILDLNESIAQLKQYTRNADYATQRLNLEETTLDSSINVLQRVRELSLQAANTGVQDGQSNRAIAAELREKLSELMDYANTKDASGDYLFSGFQSKTQPFTQDGAGNISYNGDQGQLLLQISAGRQVASTDSGADIFQRIRMGNGQFSVDAYSANSGSGIISTGSVVNPAVYQAEDFQIEFTAADTYDVINTTTGVTVQTAQIFSPNTSIQFNGLSVDISGTPDAGDTFTVRASRNQDIFTGLQNLIDTIERPVSGNIRGSFGGDYVNNGFDVGDTVAFNLEFDGVTIPINYTPALADTNTEIAAAMFSEATPTAPNSSIKSFADANPAIVTDNGDGTFTLQGNTAGLSMTFELGGANNTDIVFSTNGGNADDTSNLQITGLQDDDVSAVGTNASLDIMPTGTSVASPSILTATAAGASAVFAPSALSNSMVSQQIGNSIINIDRAMESIINAQTSIGGRINSIESQLIDNDARNEQLQAIRGSIEDLDIAEAISQLTFQTTALQVAQQTFVRIQNLSLFNII